MATTTATINISSDIISGAPIKQSLYKKHW